VLAIAEFFVPILKGWATEDAVALTSDAIQVHGGMGFIEETGAAQHYRDARIMPIYEGTTAIQSNDLIGRKVIRNQGATAEALFADIDRHRRGLALRRRRRRRAHRRPPRAAVDAARRATADLIGFADAPRMRTPSACPIDASASLPADGCTRWRSSRSRPTPPRRPTRSG
jgi:hypothetical protein